MKSNAITISCLLTVIIPGFGSFAQHIPSGIKSENYKVVHWQVDDGMERPTRHNAILKDIEGFLWIGSDHHELCRFDGSRFRQFYPDKNKPGSIFNIKCISMLEDSLHNIWIGLSTGLSRYDIRSDTFSNFPDKGGPDKLNKSIIPFWATRNHVFCIESGNQFATYDVRTFQKSILGQILPSDSVQLFIPAISYTIYEEASNSIWMLMQNQEGLVRFDLKTGSRIKYWREPIRTEPDQLGHRDAEAMCFDRKRNCIWINSHDGLFKFSLSDRKFKPVNVVTQMAKKKNYSRMVGIDLDKQGKVWLVTYPAGIIIYDPTANSLSQPIADTNLQKNLANGNLKIYCDRDGMVWTSYWSINGIYQLIPFSPSVTAYMANPAHPDSLSSLDIPIMLPGDKNQLWIGTQNGLNIFDVGTAKFTVFREKDFTGMKGTSIIPMVVNSKTRKAWLNSGPPDEVYEMNMDTRECKRVLLKAADGSKLSPKRNIINFISQPFRDECLFYDGENGIFQTNSETGDADRVIDLSGQIIRMISVRDEYLFILRPPERFTYQYNRGNWVRIAHVMDSIQWTTMYFDQVGQTLWVAAEGRLIQYSKDFKIIRQFEGSAGSLSTVYSLVPDLQGNLWFNNSRRTIGKLDTKSGIISLLSESDGYRNQWYNFLGSPGTSAGGELFFAGNSLAEGTYLARVNPDKQMGFPPSQAYLRKLEIRDYSMSAGASLNNLRQLSLEHYQNRINIEAGTLDFFSMGRNHIRYKLEGKNFNENWQYSPTYSTIHYEELPPGSYKLLIQASNVSNDFNGPTRTLDIVITPAFWNTWWFRSLVILAFASLLYGIIRWRLQEKFRIKLERSQREKEISDIRQRATELEMQALRAQMNPHFIFNSLNSINRFILQNNRELASEYLTKFSRLVRLILQNSQEPLISLESELESLQLYLDLEAVRFEHRFEYHVSVDKELDTEILKVPPLIIQPYAENAIWHGLMHLPDREAGKETKGQLNIEVIEQSDHLFFRIADNGIGREAARALKSKSATKHKSVGMKITSERIAALQKTNGTESPVTIRDLVHEDGSAAGTEITIKIPALYD